jgi:hypothetical protein
MGPAWLMDLLAVPMVAIAVYEVGRLSMSTASGRRSERDVDAFHLAMGVSMAGMLTNHLSPFAADAWAVVFAGLAVWFACRVPWAVAVHTNAPPSLGHRLSHVVSSLAMVYMLVAVPSGYYATGAMRAMSAGGDRLPALSLLLAAALLAGIVVHAAASLRAEPWRLAADDGPAFDPPLSVGPGALATRESPVTSVATPLLAPRLASACQVVMGLVMVYMLLSMA